ncbi:hypothetical protein XENOCAPTIV_010156 [Xenoophorus captivus]|uniref:Uncharacterized protein n=1 Tax=Xenoophorus captivus TaxID=1517983 RepID=A0ABV0R0M8_9TELE
MEAGIIPGSKGLVLFPVKASFRVFPPMCFQCYTKTAARVSSLLILYCFFTSYLGVLHWFFAGLSLVLYDSSSKCLILALKITIRRNFNISISNLFCHVSCLCH